MKIMKKRTTFELCLIALFVALNAAFAQIAVPIPGVPLTMQTFAVPLTGAILGWKKGGITLAVYILLGLVVPIYSPGSTAGLARLAGPTGGFLLAFPIYAMITGAAAARVRRKRLWLAIGLISGAVVMFALGGVVWPLLLGYAPTVQAALAGWVLPFLLGDTLKIAIVFTIAPPISKALLKASAS
jgi:biotin transport system substrate-specific component